MNSEKWREERERERGEREEGRERERERKVITYNLITRTVKCGLATNLVLAV